MLGSLRRHEQITDLLCDQSSVRAEPLSVHPDVSSATIRNDLRYLEQKRCVMRSHDDAVPNQHFVPDRFSQDKDRLNRDVKTHTAKEAASFAKNDDTLILDSGSITTLIPPMLKNRRDLMVVTNALNIVWELASFECVDVMIPGGNVRQSIYSLYGPSAEHQSRRYRFDKLFLGVDGFCLEAGIIMPHPGEAYPNQVICEVVQEVTVVADSSKFGRKSFCMTSETSGVDRVVTDSGIPEDYHRTLTQLGVDVVIVDE